MADAATPVRARRMPPAPRALACAPAAPTASRPVSPGSASEAETATTPVSRFGFGRRERSTESNRSFVTFSNQMGRPATMHPAAALPERVGPYRVYASLGAGGVGMVYEAED